MFAHPDSRHGLLISGAFNSPFISDRIRFRLTRELLRSFVKQKGDSSAAEKGFEDLKELVEQGHASDIPTTVDREAMAASAVKWAKTKWFHTA